MEGIQWYFMYSDFTSTSPIKWHGTSFVGWHGWDGDVIRTTFQEVFPLFFSHIIAKRLSARLLILQCVFSVGEVWSQFSSRFRNAICHASGMQARVLLVCKHPSHLGMQLKFLFTKSVYTYVSLLLLALWQRYWSHCPKTVMGARKKELGEWRENGSKDRETRGSH